MSATDVELEKKELKKDMTYIGVMVFPKQDDRRIRIVEGVDHISDGNWNMVKGAIFIC